MSNLEETKEFLKKFCLKKCNHNSNESCICKVALCFKEIEKSQEQEKVLEIIKEKGVDVATFNTYQSVIEYNWSIRFEKHKRKELTEEEYDAVKGYFNDR